MALRIGLRRPPAPKKGESTVADCAAAAIKVTDLASAINELRACLGTRPVSCSVDVAKVR